MEEILIAILIAIAGFFGSKLIEILQGIQKSIESLNIKIAVVIEKTEGHENRIKKLEEKV